MQFFQRALSSHKNSVSSLKKTVCLVVKLHLPERILFTQQECVRPIEKCACLLEKSRLTEKGNVFTQKESALYSRLIFREIFFRREKKARYFFN